MSMDIFLRGKTRCGQALFYLKLMRWFCRDRGVVLVCRHQFRQKQRDLVGWWKKCGIEDPTIHVWIWLPAIDKHHSQSLSKFIVHTHSGYEPQITNNLKSIFLWTMIVVLVREIISKFGKVWESRIWRWKKKTNLNGRMTITYIVTIF